MKHKKGFTLMEMLIVVAIIAILIAIAIPTFNSSLKKARAATCQANCRSMKAIIMTSYMADGKDSVEASFQANKDSCACPDKGVISYSIGENGQATVYCSKHSPGGANAGNNLEEAFNAAASTNDFDFKTRIDSTAVDGTNSMQQKILAQLKAQGIDLTASGIKTWTIIKDNTGAMNYIWSSYDIAAGQYKSVPAISYKVGADGKVSYVVGVSNVGTKTETSSGNTYRYNIIAQGVDKNGFNPASGKTFTTKEEAEDYYNTLKTVNK